MKCTWVYGALLWCSFFIAAQDTISLLIVDTQGKDPYYYRNLIMLARSVGFNVDYKNLYDVLEESEINHYQALFFMLNPAMLNMSLLQQFCNKLYCLMPIQRTHAIPEHCLTLLRTFAQQQNKAIGIILPSGIKSNPRFVHHAKQTVYEIGQFQSLSSELQIAVDAIIKHLIECDNQIGSLFGTSLINSTQTLPSPFVSPSCTEAHYVPHAPHYSTLTQYAFPLGLLIEHPKQHNIYLISTSSAYNFADINEHLFKNPLNFSHRTELLKAAQETLQYFHDAYMHQKIPVTVTTPELPSPLTLTYLQRAKKHTLCNERKQIDHELYGWMLTTPIACAWLDPYDFFAHEDGEQQLKKLITDMYPLEKNDARIKNLVEQIALQRGIRIIYDGNFQLLWLECIPEWYLSPHGLHKDQKDEYITRIKKIGLALRTFFNAHHTPLPKIFIGLNLTSNFKSYPVANPVQSVSGTRLSKIPSPFDIDHFWQPEVLDIFEAFVTIFKDSLPIDGVFFDFEMYHAQDQTGSYTDHMDFSDSAWKTYCAYTKDNAADHINNVKNRLAYLQHHKKFKHYFAVLERASRDIGQMIKKRMRHLVPHLLFAAYAPTLPSCWFYRGIMAGLSSPSQPLILATFNTDYQSHLPWLIQHNIHLLHGTAIMLSKLHTPDNSNVIKTQLTHHDFVWYNRPSRMIYAYNQDQLNKMWWGIEATPASCSTIMHTILNCHTP